MTVCRPLSDYASFWHVSKPTCCRMRAAGVDLDSGEEVARYLVQCRNPSRKMLARALADALEDEARAEAQSTFDDGQ